MRVPRAFVRHALRWILEARHRRRGYRDPRKRRCNSCNALPHCLGAVGSATPAMHCLTAWEQWAVELLQCVVWCGVVWCGVVWCGVVWCGVPKALLPKGKRPGCLPTGTGKRAGLCVLCARCV